jgi:hypothetical protein
MDANKVILPFERPVVDMFRKLGEGSLTLCLLVFAAFCVYIAMKKDSLLLKSILLTYIILP